jgi:hypothetical protein
LDNAAADLELRTAIHRIRQQELGHLRFAIDHAGTPRMFDQVIDRVISTTTASLIWLSTYGSHSMMRRAIEKP